MAAAIKLLKKDLGIFADDFLDKSGKAGGGIIDAQDVTDALVLAITKGQFNLNDYKYEICAGIAQQRIKNRSNHGLPQQLNLFTQYMAEREMIRLGNRQLISMANARFAHLLIKRDHEREAIRKTTIQANRTDQLILLVEPEMAAYPERSLTNAMVILKHPGWPGGETQKERPEEERSEETP